MLALKEITDWGNKTAPNHTYLLDGTNLVAYIKQGDAKPFYFKSPIKGFDKRARKFVEVKPNPFEVRVESHSKRESKLNSRCCKDIKITLLLWSFNLEV